MRSRLSRATVTRCCSERIEKGRRDSRDQAIPAWWWMKYWMKMIICQASLTSTRKLTKLRLPALAALSLKRTANNVCSNSMKRYQLTPFTHIPSGTTTRKFLTQCFPMLKKSRRNSLAREEQEEFKIQRLIRISSGSTRTRSMTIGLSQTTPRSSSSASLSASRTSIFTTCLFYD